MNHLKKHWMTYAAGIGGFTIGAITIVGVKAKNFILGPNGKRLGE
jgi:hypothetical protein